MKKKRIFLKLIILLIILTLTGIISLYAVAYFSPKISIHSVKKYQIYNTEKNVINNSDDKNWVKLDDISPNVIKAVISSEDKRFYKHQGFDYLRIMKAFFKNLTSGQINEGASTISQQFIKNMFLTFDKTWERKIKEAYLTLRLEVHYSKKEILEGYLNSINYGYGNYGIYNASRFYFNKLPSDLSLEEALILTGIPKSPNNYNPVKDYSKAIKRGKQVALAMVYNKQISKKEYRHLFQKDIAIVGKQINDISNNTLYYVDAVLDELKQIDTIPESTIDAGGLKIYTYLDSNKQNILENKVALYMNNVEPEIASVIIDPVTGGVNALIGGKDYTKSPFNRAINSKRQVGSTMKPFLYYAALENGFTSSSTFLSEPATFVFSNNKEYSPSNYGEIYGKQNITMAAAIALSDNIYAVKTHLFLGEDVLVKTASRMGITANLKANPSLALGTGEINMLDFATGYTTLASNGYKRELKLIKYIEDSEGNKIYKNREQSDVVLNQSYLYILNEMLSNTSNIKFKNYANPTALSISPQFTKKYAIKTGTTSTDYWIAGFNPRHLMLVWVGNDDSSDVSSKYASITKKVWVETTEEILKNEDNVWYDVPSNVVALPLDPITGKENSNQSVLFYYVNGTETNKKADILVNEN